MKPPFDYLKSHPSKTREWLNRPEAAPFMQFIRQLAENANKELKSADNLLLVGREQGKLEILQRIYDLSKEIEDYQRKVSSGVLPRPASDKGDE